MRKFGFIRLLRDDISFLHKIYYKIFGVSADHKLRFKYLNLFLRRFINFKIPSKILDAGCGSGDYSFYFAERYPRCKVLGIDISENIIKKNNNLLKITEIKNLNFTHKSILTLDFKEEFDFICCIDVLEHINEQKRALMNLFNALTKNGYLYVHIPLKRLKPVIFNKYLINFHEWVEDEHIAESHTKKSILKLLNERSFKVIEARSTFNHYFGEFAVSIIMLFYKNTSFNQIILSLLTPFLWLLIFLDITIKHKKGNAIAIILKKL